MTELPTIVQELNSNVLRYTLACLNPDNDHLVAFDQLDLGFDPHNPDHANRLIGLLLASRDINIAAKNSGARVTGRKVSDYDSNP